MANEPPPPATTIPNLFTSPSAHPPHPDRPATPPLPTKSLSESDSSEYQTLLASCATEPIHIPGSIQQHGFLLAIDSSTKVIKISSKNVEDYLGLGVDKVLGRELGELLADKMSQTQFGRNLSVLKNAESGSILTVSLNLKVQGEGDSQRPQTFYTTLHRTTRNPHLTLLELEPRPSLSSSPDDNFFFIQTLIHQFNAAQHTQKELIKLAVDAISDVTQFDRVMCYWFDADWHGVVVEEVIGEGFPEGEQRYLGLHFPDGDIPRQARELYLLNKIRVLANRCSEPSPLVALPPPPTEDGTDPPPPKPLDLTFATLRSVSPMHIKYLKNMRVVATMSVAVMVSGRLWGLIACHHYSEKTLPHHVRSTCLYISSFLSTSLENMEHAKREEQRKKIIQIAGMRKNWEIEDAGLGLTDSSFGSSISAGTEDTGGQGGTLYRSIVASSLGFAPPERPVQTGVAGGGVVADVEDFWRRVVPDIKGWIKADYAVVYHDSKLHLFDIPSEHHSSILTSVNRYVQWASKTQPAKPYISVCMSEDLPDFPGGEEGKWMAGVVHIPVNDAGGADWIAWFGMEQLLHVEWGGAKDKAVKYDPEKKTIEPRQSFEAWKEVVTGHSRPWDEPLCRDADLLSTLQTVLTNVMNSWRSHLLRVAHFEAMDRNARLVLEQKMEKEAQWRKNMLLNNVSHELRTPLHTIKAALGLLAEGHGEGLGGGDGGDGGMGGAGREDQRELLMEASQANEELTRLIDHLMVSFGFPGS
ncbi:hypothetical protein HK097_010498 [Rhizophlyctis rosea]|uniref:Phytochrome chromophore attachment site domain-containing protein n=1 Tax=Rhizophlyctis rosea TaxID=64517 RepID=A0AAD5S9T3_9FUNG|nr:hypothetical protein HK097_010498 [Rhizophlyctis rosea]